VDPRGRTVTPGSSLTATAPGGLPVLFARSVDVAGNVSIVQQENTPGPSTTILTSPAPPTGPSGSWLHAPTVTLAATGTAPLTTYYSWNTTDTVATVGNTPVVPTGSGVQTLRYFSVDGVPTTETVHTSTFYVLDQQSFTITPLAGPNGSMLPAAPLAVTGGTNTAVTITPDSGYHVAAVLVDGLSVGVPPSYTFTSVTANHTIAVTFSNALIPTNLTMNANHTGVPRGHLVHFSGVIQPNMPNGTPVAFLVRKARTISWVRAVPYVRTFSGYHWSYHYHPRTHGIYYIKVRFSATSTYAAVNSRTVKVTWR